MKITITRLFLFIIVLSSNLAFGQQQIQNAPFEIGTESFMLNGKPFVIRCGEMHFARIPRAYWRHRLKMAKAAGLNTVCAYLFWNFHETLPGKFTWEGQADAAEFCKIAQQEGLYVLLRPGPYACAEWEFGGLPWWLLKKKDIKLRTQDLYYMERSRQYLKEVGRVLAPLQITNGGPIIMTQVENEYGSYGADKEYMLKIRDYLKEAGFVVPLFSCDGTVQLKNDVQQDIFAVVNFGNNPEAAFKTLRDVQPTGPLMCGEYYPGWFDSWGAPHHTGSNDHLIRELGWMLDHKASFSIYMIHGGTSFGLWAGANCQPYTPETSSYDYDAPISENGTATAKFDELRNTLKKYLQPGEVLTDVPAPIPVQKIAPFNLQAVAPIMPQLNKPVYNDTTLYMEDLNQGYGMMLYETNLPAGAKRKLDFTEVHDYAEIFIDNQLIGILNRMKNDHILEIPKLYKPAKLRVFVEAMGRVNYGYYLHDRKGLQGEVYDITNANKFMLKGWKHYSIPLGEGNPAFKYKTISTVTKLNEPAFYKGYFNAKNKADFYLDMRWFKKGVAWINGHCLGRYWNIGPTQTMYVPGVWLNKGKNEVVVLDLHRPIAARLQGLSKPILDSLTTNETISSNHRKPGQKFMNNQSSLIYAGAMENTGKWQTFTFAPKNGRYLALEALNNFTGDQFAALAEVELLDEHGEQLPRSSWKVVYADSEELKGNDGKSENLFDLQYTSIWHSQWKDLAPKYPHQVVIDLGGKATISGIKMLPRQDMETGRIKEFRVYLADKLFTGL
ncbi:beta-galactosidase [Mucilaginibacter gossypiicola]|uniref:Beta-galactosidase n=1 Tax=Mucilaginibacter gossypiicola TaxID=551995 RepID=A0A1H8BRC2_9SPHI|nr:beta-galactosidase [Mucilaginibacter gossypiicola]SEM84674.1 beta-galactosidase [Mucilaginibacter gossypiicola]